MLTLAIDTALQKCSAVILQDKAVIGEHSIDLEKGHAERIAPLVSDVVADAGIAISDLQRIVVSTGPGSFAGIRVGLSFARGLAIGQNIDVIGVNTLLALAVSAPRDGNDRVAVIAGPQEQFFAARFDQGFQPVVAPLMAGGEDVVKLLSADHGDVSVIGCMKKRDLEFPKNWTLLSAEAQISVSHLAEFGRAVSPDKFPPTPLYLRQPDAAPAKPSFFADLLP